MNYMKTLAFWHEYPGSQPEPDKPVEVDATVILWAIYFFLITMVATGGFSRR